MKRILLIPLLFVCVADPARADPYTVIRTITHTDNALWYSAGGNLQPLLGLGPDHFVIATRHRRATGGAAYVFAADDGSFLRRLTASDAADGMEFGHSLAVDGGKALVGAPFKFISATNRGKAYLFDLATGTETRTFTQTDGDGNADEFGKSVALAGTTAVFGAPKAGLGAAVPTEFARGRAYAFDTTTGNLLWMFAASDWEANAELGTSVAVSGGEVLVGAPGATSGGFSDGGKAYVYDLATGAERYILAASDAAQDDRFGAKVSITGNYYVVASPNDDDGEAGSGSVYLFSRTTGVFVRKFGGSPAVGGAAFGLNHSVSGESVLTSQDFDGTTFGFYDLASGNRSELVSDPAVFGTPAWRDTILLVGRGTTTAPDQFTLADGNFTIQVLSNDPTPVPASAPSVNMKGKRRLTLTRRRLILRGTASDVDGDLVRVEVKVGRKPFVAARGTASWSFAVSGLKPGRNTIQIRSKDAAGNISPTVKLTVILK